MKPKILDRSKLYPERAPFDLEPHYSRHVAAMTAEGLDSKTEIAAQLAWRDAELEKHQDLVEALQWLPAGTVVDFCDLDDFLEEVRRDGWRPHRECSHVFRGSDECVHCGIDVEELKGVEGG